jgi:hypothetical protein
MSKNLTRKGLAFGAIVALGSSLFAGAPASAAGLLDNKVTLAPANGVATYGTTLAGNFVLTSNYVDSIETSGKYQKFLVTDATKQVMSTVDDNPTGTLVGDVLTGAASAAATGAETFDTSNSFVASRTDNANTDAVLVLSLPSTVTATTPVTVQSWYDSNANGEIDSTESASAPVTVTFYKTADITATVTLNAPAVGNTTLAGTATFSPALNATYSSNLDVEFYEHGVAAAVAGTATWNTTTKVWDTVSSSLGTAVAAGGTYGVQGLVGTTASGVRVNKSVVATTASTVKLAIVPSADVNAAGTIRLGASTAVVRATVKDAAGATLPAGIPVKFIATYAAATGVKLNGVAKATTEFVFADTNASGVAEVTVYVGSAVATNTVVITAVSQGVSQTTAATLTYAARQYKVVEDKDVNNSSYRAVAAGGSYTFNVSVVDQWGTLLTSSTDTYGLTATITGRTVSTATTALSGGKAAITVGDGNVTGTTAVVALDIVKKDGSTWAVDGLTSPVEWSDGTPNGAADDKRTVTFYAAASYSVSATSSDKTQNIDADAVATLDSRFGNAALEAYDDTNSRVTITGNTGVAGAEVTLSSTGLMFLATSGATKSSLDSITVFSGASGAYSVDVVSNKAVSDAIVTVTSMGSTATVKEINFEAALVADSFKLSVPAYTGAGRAVEVTAILADEYGNKPAAGAYITFSSTGAGYLNATSATVGRDGKATVRLVIGATETGSAVITATTTNTDIAAAKRTVTATVTIGAAPVAGATAAIAGSTKRFFVSVDNNPLAKNVVVKVAGKTFKTLKGSSAKKSYAVAAPKGSHKVTVYVGGKLIATKTISVK